MGHAHAALRPIGPCVLSVQMSVFVIPQPVCDAHCLIKALRTRRYGDVVDPHTDRRELSKCGTYSMKW